MEKHFGFTKVTGEERKSKEHKEGQKVSDHCSDPVKNKDQKKT